jgi:hypothetical protein
MPHFWLYHLIAGHKVAIEYVRTHLDLTRIFSPYQIKNINNPQLTILATRLRDYTHRTNAKQVSIVKIQTDQTRCEGYLNEKPRSHNPDVT